MGRETPTAGESYSLCLQLVLISAYILSHLHQSPFLSLPGSHFQYINVVKFLSTEKPNPILIVVPPSPFTPKYPQKKRHVLLASTSSPMLYQFFIFYIIHTNDM